MRNYFREDDVPHSIRTDIQVNEISWLELFAEANEMTSMKFGYWEERNGFAIHNKVCYVMLNPAEKEEANLIYMKLKYGSFENAFTEYMKEVRKRK